MDEGRQPPRVLVVEDDEHVAAVQLEHLRQAGLRTEHLARGDAVVAHVRAQAPDLVLLDLMLPGADGTEVCRALRAFSNVPILMVTARVEEADRLRGFDLGADDYLCKPFSPRELVARVQALLRRLGRLPQPAPAQPAAARLLEIDAAGQRALCHGRPLDLTPQEYRLLAVMAVQPGRVFPRAQLIELAYDGSTEVFDRAVDSHVKNLRRKLAAAAPGLGFIHSVYGVGYRFEVKAQAEEPGRAGARPPLPGAEQPVCVPADLRERLPDFLASRRALIEEARQALERHELDAVRRLAHRLAGSFALYGYTWAAQGCLRIENAAVLEPVQVASWLESLLRHLDGAPVRFVAAT
jgi:two-component system response regulator BaeR